jgi:hypothetical protein
MKILGISGISLAASLGMLVSGAAGAAEGPEAVYAKLHRATLAGNVEEVLSYSSAQKRAELASMPGKEDAVHMAAMSLPKSYSITSRKVSGAKAHLKAQGVIESDGPARGEVELVREKGEWKVDEWSWARLAQASKDAAPVDAKGAKPQEPAAAEKAADATAGPQPVEPIPAVPVDAPTLRRATAEDIGCVIKPVMTDDELRRCGATPPKYD